MAPVGVQYTGSLQPKKKSELQEIAQALDLDDQGTKDDLQIRIKKHLEDHHSELEEDPAFVGLLGRRKRSVQPSSRTVQQIDAVVVEVKPSSRGRKTNVLEAIREATPAKDQTEADDAPEITPPQSPQRDEAVPTPSSLPPLPSSPISPTKSIIQNLRSADVPALVEDIKRFDLAQTGKESFFTIRHFLSNSRNILILTAFYELLYISYTIIPWKTTRLSLWKEGTVSISFGYPPLATFQTIAFWTVLLHWFIPTVLSPLVIGNLISFNPSLNQRQQEDYKDVVVFDSLTAAIVQLAAQIAYPYTSLDIRSGVQGLDVLGFKFRVWSASLGLAFAFAETISGAPQAFAQTFAQTLRRDRRLLTPSRGATPQILG